MELVAAAETKSPSNVEEDGEGKGRWTALNGVADEVEAYGEVDDWAWVGSAGAIVGCERTVRELLLAAFESKFEKALCGELDGRKIDEV